MNKYNDKDLLKRITKCYKNIRINAINMTQKKLAESIGVSQSLIASFEKGNLNSLSMANVYDKYLNSIPTTYKIEKSLLKEYISYLKILRQKNMYTLNYIATIIKCDPSLLSRFENGLVDSYTLFYRYQFILNGGL